MKKLILISALFVMILASNANAQSLTTVSYSMGIGTGNLGEYTPQFSGRGMTLDFREMVQSNIGVGFSLGWNVFYDELPYDTYTIDNRSLSGRQYRTVNAAPLMVAADYYFNPGNDFNPFLGIGVGGIYYQRDTDMGIYRLNQNAFTFGFVPQAGFHYSLNSSSALSFAVKYNLGLAGGDFDNSQSYLSLNIGFLFLGR